MSAVLRHDDPTALVASCGTSATAPWPATNDTIRAARSIGLNISEHRSTAIADVRIADFDLVVTATMAQLQSAVVDHGATLGTTWLWNELAQRCGQQHLQRRDDEDVNDWIQRLGQGRSAQQLAALSTSLDLADPTGSGRRAHKKTALELQRQARYITAAWKSGDNRP